MKIWYVATLLALILPTLSGCALTSKADPLEVRYFSAEPAAGPGSTAAGAIELRGVRAASHLTAKMLYRVSSNEYGYHETQRWTDDPAQYLRRGLERALFAGGGLKRARVGDHPFLEVELTAFESVQTEGSAEARVGLTLFLYDGRTSLAYRTIEVTQSVSDPTDGSSVAAACALALEAAIAEAIAVVDAALKAKG